VERGEKDGIEESKTHPLKRKEGRKKKKKESL